MKRVFLLIVLLSCVHSSVRSALAQEQGNRIYGNRGYYNQQRRQPPADVSGGSGDEASHGFQCAAPEGLSHKNWPACGG